MGLGSGGFGVPLVGAETSWAAQLLAASVLSLGFLSTGAQNGTSEPPMMLVEGDGLTLTYPPLPENATRCTWCRGTGFDSLIFGLSLPWYVWPSFYGPGYTGKERMGPDCSISLQKVDVRQSGTYTRHVEGPGLDEKWTFDIVVVERLSLPTISISSKPFPRLAIDPLRLTCDTKATRANINWFLNGTLVEKSSRIQLSDRNRTLAIQKVLSEDDGKYQCQVFNVAFSKMSNALYVSVIYPPFPNRLGPGAMAGIVVGSLAAGVALVGALVYVFLRINRKGKERTSAPVSYAPTSHENVPL